MSTKVITAYTDWVAMSPSGQYLYTAYGVGGHVYASSDYDNTQTVSLVKIDRTSMEIVGTVELANSATEPRVRDYAFTSNGSGMVVILQGDDETVMPAEVITVDLDEMAVTNNIDISPVTTAAAVVAAAAEVPPRVLTATPSNEPVQLAVSGDAATAYVAFRGDADIYTVDITSGDTDAMGSTVGSYTHGLNVGPDGRLMVSTEGTGLIAIDLSDNSETVIRAAGTMISHVFTDDGASVIAKETGSQLVGFKLEDDSQLDFDGDTTDATPGAATSIIGVTVWDELLMVSPY